MGISFKNVLFIIVILVVLALIVLPRIDDSGRINRTEETDNDSGEKEAGVRLYFRDLNKSINLDGELYLDDEYEGNVTPEGIILKRTEKNPKSLCFVAELPESYGKNSGIIIKNCWDIHDWQGLINQEEYTFDLEFNPRRPYYEEEIQSYVRPEETEPFFKDVYFKSNNSVDRIDSIVLSTDTNIRYYEDRDLFKELEYWQKPSEVLKHGEGDCEDWTLATLSMIIQDNNSINCYSLGLETHMTIFCIVGNVILFRDQDGVRTQNVLRISDNEMDNKVAIRNTKNRYLDEYGIPVSENAFRYAFNDKEFLYFEETEDFTKWVYETWKYG